MDEHAAFETQAVLPPRRRRGNAIGVLLTGLAVTGIVGAGALGGLTTEPPVPPAVPAIADAPTAPASAAASPGPTAEPGPIYPRSVLGLQVWTAAYVSTYGFGYFAGSFAVAGWFMPTGGTGCPTPRVAEDPSLALEFGVAADPDTFCQRSGSLFTGPLFDENVRPIEIELRPGVPAPPSLKDIAIVTPVVLVGKLQNPGAACHSPGSCPSHMVVDRVAWSGGKGQVLTTSVLPDLLDHWPPLSETQRNEVSVRAIGYQGSVLLETLVDPGTLAKVDPYAAKLLAAAAPKADRIWYRRVLGPDPTEDSMRWVAIDDATGRLIATGTAA